MYQDGKTMIEILGLSDMMMPWNSIGWEQTEELTDEASPSAT
jgi:hypothetical protein